MGHDGPAHVAIAQEQPTLRALKLYHGKRGAGLSVELQVRYGPITIVGCTQTADGRAEAAGRRGRVDPRRHVPDRQHEQPPALRAPARRVLRALVRGGPDPPRRARRRPRRATRCARSPRCSGSSPRRWAEVERVCFLLRVRPDRLEEYKARHRAVWPEMLDALRATGWGNYSLFLAEDGLLVGYLETEDFAAAVAAHGGDRRQRPLAGGDGRVLRAAVGRAARHRPAAPRGGLPPCLTGLRRDRPRRHQRARRHRPPRRTGGMTLEEVHRFHNRPVRLPDGLRWNLLHLFTEALEGLRRAGPLRGVGVDTWGVDYALLDGDGRVLGPAVPLPRRAHRGHGRARVRARARRPSCTPPPASRRCRSTPSSSCSPTRARPRSPPPSGSRSCPTCSRYWLCGELANESHERVDDRAARRAQRRAGRAR